MLKGKINDRKKLVGSIHVSSVVSQETDYYEGSYELIPSENDQTLNVKNKTMMKDFTVKAIPYEEADNEFGGITVMIGG